MAYGRGPSPLLTGTLVGGAVWLTGYLVAVGVLALAAPVPGPEFTLWGFAATIMAAGTVPALFLLVGDSYPVLWLLPSIATLGIATAGGAIVTERTGRSSDAWPAVKAGATVCLGISLTTITVLAVYLVPSTPVANTPVSFRYVILLFGNLLLPALFGALGGSIQYTLSTRHNG